VKSINSFTDRNALLAICTREALTI